MANNAVAQTYKNQLKRIKKNIESSNISFKKNNDRFHEFFKFVFETAISESDKAALSTMGKPIVEFNITNAPISRLCGEFSKQMPSIKVMAENGMPVEPEVIEVVEGHIRHILDDANKHNAQYNIYKDQLGGGFSGWKIYTDYANEMTFKQIIMARRVYEPTLCGFDQNAREVSKQDAEFCYEFFPMPKEKFKDDYPDVDLNELSFGMDNDSLNWSYSCDNEDIVLVCDYYEKKRKRFKIVEVAGHGTMAADDYKKLLEDWELEARTEQAPIVTNERWTTKQTIVRFRIVGTEVIDRIETDYKYLPIIFVDGDSVIIKNASSAAYKQFTKPYVYHAKGIQRLVNFSGQVIGNDFENMVMHKFKVAKESIPQEEIYQEAYENVQQASTLVYNAFMDNDPDKPIPPPQEIVRVPLPPEVLQTFNTSMQMLQNILGSYDASLGINDNQLSGTAIVEAATQSNAAAMPYVVSHMQALSHVATCILDLIPKYYKTTRTIPVIDRDGVRSYQIVNKNGYPSFNYDENALSVKVEAGPNFAIQKARALNQIMLLMQASPLFAQFMNEVGLSYILDNMEFRGSEVLAEKSKQWMEELQKKQAQAQQQPSPEEQMLQIEQKKVEMKAQDMQINAALKGKGLQIDEKKADTDRLELELKAGVSDAKMATDIIKAQAEEKRANADVKIKQMEVSHKLAKDMIGMDHHREDMRHGHAISTIEAQTKHRKQNHEEEKYKSESKKKPPKGKN
jgi:hypothetical protein